MKKFFNWHVRTVLILVSLSAVFYLIHYFVFKDAHHILLYLVGDIAFLFLDVLIVMLFLHRLLEYRDKQAILKKMNMVIGTFFSEVGSDLIRKCAQFDSELSQFSRDLIVTKDWTDKDFLRLRKKIAAYSPNPEIKKGDIQKLKMFLGDKRAFLLVLLENPNLLEHESFTDLLWAVFHLTDELMHRNNLVSLPETDYKHLAGDIKRAYHQLIIQWLDYMKHLKQDYPYLFSLAMRTNPFDENACVEVV